MKKARAYLPATLDAVSVMGAQIGAARRELGWTAAELADRVGVSAPVIARLENGAPGTAIGTVFEAAVLCGVALFGVDSSGLRMVTELERTRLALLPTRVRKRAVEVDDDF